VTAAVLDGSEVTLTVELAGACRLCAYDAYGVDAEGLPVHPCCVTWQRLLGEAWTGRCPACVESRKARQRRAGWKVRR
jgi:hypothetical protein